MPIDVTINHDDGIVHAICRGEITLPDVQNYQQEVWGTGKIKGYKELFDASRGDLSGFSLDDAKTIAEKDNAFDVGAGRTKKAIVIASKEQLQHAIIYTSTRFLNRVNPRTIKTFFLSSTAMQWLREKQS